MVGVNDLYMKIVKRIFKANNGKQISLIRKKIEVMEFLSTNSEINKTQQEYIDKVNEEYALYDNKIHNFLGTIPLKDIKQIETELEEL